MPYSDRYDQEDNNDNLRLFKHLCDEARYDYWPAYKSHTEARDTARSRDDYDHHESKLQDIQTWAIRNWKANYALRHKRQGDGLHLWFFLWKQHRAVWMPRYKETQGVLRVMARGHCEPGCEQREDWERDW